MPATIFDSCIHFGSTGLPCYSLSYLDSNTVWCMSNVWPHEQWCLLVNPVHVLHPGRRHFLFPLGSCSWQECLHRHFKSWDPTMYQSYIKVKIISCVLTDRYITEHFTFALFISIHCPAINLPTLNIVKVVLLVSVATETLTSRPDGLAVLSMWVPPVDIKPILSGFLDLLLEFLKFLLTH